MSKRSRQSVPREPARSEPSLFQRALLAVWPGLARARERNRLAFEVMRAHRAFLSSHAYAAGEVDRTKADWSKKRRSADSAILTDHKTVSARARLGVQNDWAIASTIDGHVRHIVGTGITPRAAARDPYTGQAWHRFNEGADREFYAWADDPRLVDVEHKRTFIDFESAAVREYKTVGQAFIVLGYVPRREGLGLTLQMIETEQLATSKTRNDETGNEIRHGIEIDAYGAPVAYYVYQDSHPLDTNIGARTGQATRILADRVLQLMRPDRARQTYGMTQLAPVLTEARHTQMYKEFTLHRAKMEAVGGASIEHDPAWAGMLGDDPTIYGLKASLDNPTGEDTDDRANKQMVWEPGMLWEPPAGRKVNWAPPTTPSATFDAFMRRQLGNIAAGAGLDYPTVARDFSKGTYSGQRQGLIELWAETDPEQARLITHVCRRVWEAAIGYAILERRLVAPLWYRGEDYRRAYLAAEWQPPAKPWISPKDMAAANISLLKMRLTTYKRILNEQGIDWRDVFRQAADEAELARSLGLQILDDGKLAPAPAGQPDSPQQDQDQWQDQNASPAA